MRREAQLIKQINKDLQGLGLAILRQSHNIDACWSLLLQQTEKDGIMPSFSNE